MILVYIAGPYRPATGWGVECNTITASALGAEVVRRYADEGVFPVVPHACTPHYGLTSDDYSLRGTMALLERCDVVLTTPDWAASKDARSEVARAEELGIPVCHSLHELGAAKYGEYSWRAVPHARARYFAACMRHVLAWFRGETADEETGRPHLAHAACNLLFLLELDAREIDLTHEEEETT